jgi:hypothetical protein
MEKNRDLTSFFSAAEGLKLIKPSVLERTKLAALFNNHPNPT